MSVKADMEAAALRKELAEAKLDIDRIKMRLCDAGTTITQFEVRAERAEKELVEAKATIARLQSAPSQSDQVAVVASQLAQQASRFLEVYQQLRDEAASRPLSTA